MERVYTDADATPGLVRSRRIAVLGYGGQGHAHAQNLRDSGCHLVVGLYEGSPSAERARSDGFEVLSVAEACRRADLISVLLPDQLHHRVFEESIRVNLTPDSTLMMAAAFSVQYGLVAPPTDVDVALVAPVGPGSMMRRLYRKGSGIPALFAVWQDVTGSAEPVALSYAAAVGCTRVGVLRTTFAEETVTDLFGEQAVMCGGLSALIKAGFDTLVDAGYRPELAYFECLHQVRLIADLIGEGGLAFMHRSISDTAEFGDYVTGPRIIDAHVRENMRAALGDVEDGTFARRWMSETEAGLPTMKREREAEEASTIERIGAELRRLIHH